MESQPMGPLSFDGLSFEDITDLVLRQEPLPLRIEGMRLLAERVQNEPSLAARLAENLRDVYPSARRRAAQTLSACGSAAQSAIKELCEAMQTDPIWTVREAAVNAVRAISWPTSEEYRSDDVPMQLVEIALSDREPLVREGAIQGLMACLSDERVLEEVKATICARFSSALLHPHASRRCRAVSAACQLSEPNGWGDFAIHRGLRDSHWKVRRTTLQALGEHPELVVRSPSAFLLPELMKRLFDQHPGVRSASHETVGRLIVAFHDQAAASLLVSLTTKPSAVETLLTALRDFPLPPSAAHQFHALCCRRADWHLQNLSEAIVAIPSASPESMVRRLFSLAAKWQVSAKRLAQDPEAARQEAEEKEAAWLLARWLESYFGESVAATNG